MSGSRATYSGENTSGTTDRLEPLIRLKPEFVSAVSGAVMEIERILFSTRSEGNQIPASTMAAVSSLVNTTRASSFELQKFAKERLAWIRATGEASPTRQALETFETIVKSLVVDDGPTPQVAATPSGSIEIQWLVEGVLLSALFDEDGNCSILAVDERNDVLIDEEAVAKQVFPSSMPEVEQLLAAMSTRIVDRPLLRGARGKR